MKKRPIVILVCIYIVVLIWILVWQPQMGERLFSWEEKERRLRERYEGKTEFEGLVLSVQEKKGSSRARIRLKKEVEQSETVECILIYDEQDRGAIQGGRRIKIQGDLWWPEGAMNPGQWDAEQYARIQKIDFYIRVSKWEYIGKGDSSWLLLLGTLRSWFSRQIESIWQGENGEIIKAMLLGETGAMDESTTELFRKGGISHIIAISGLHLTIIGEILRKVLSRFQKPKATQLEVNVFLWIYTLFVGASVSTLRAVIMASVRMAAALFDREEDSLNTLALTAGILLVNQPLYILDAGFTLSFAAILGMKYGKILFMSLPLIPYRLRRYMAASGAISLATTPLSLWFFYEASVYGFLLNFWVVPSMEVLLMGTLAAIGGSGIHPALGKGIAACVDLLLVCFQKGSEVVSGWPGATLRGKPYLHQMMAIYGLWILASLYYSQPAKRARRIRIFALGVFLGVVASYRPNFWRIMYLDVGQGDCAVIEWNKNVFLVDAGPEYENVIKPYLMQRGIWTIDGVILSHADSDHMEGVSLLSDDKDFVIKRLWVADEKVQENENRLRLEENIWNYGGQVQRIKAGYAYQSEDFSIDILSPVKQHDDSNEGSLVVELEIEGWRFLFPGDIGEKTEKEVMNRWNDVDVLKVAHHGSKHSTSDVFLRAVRPEAAIISCGRNNRYGHPHEETINKMKEQQIDYFVTAESGAIWIEEVKDQLKVRQYRLE